MNENIELINKLRSFCEQYDDYSCFDCPIFCKGEDNCPLLIVITRLAESEGINLERDEDDIDIVFTGD